MATNPGAQRIGIIAGLSALLWTVIIGAVLYA
jgi:hypothetical protein